MKTTQFDNWWNEQSKKGDPLRNPSLVRDAFEAGRRAGQKDAERDLRDVAAEASWKERQGDEYGSF